MYILPGRPWGGGVLIIRPGFIPGFILSEMHIVKQQFNIARIGDRIGASERRKYSMTKGNSAKRPAVNAYEQRKRRTQRIIFVIISVIIILSWVVGLLINV